MAKKILWSGSVTLPAPVEISVNDEIIWSSNTGRLASGEMAGDVIAEKKDVSIKWEEENFYIIRFHSSTIPLAIVRQ